MRAFVAVEVPSPETTGPGRTAAPTHLTLRFLGETPSERIGSIVERLHAVGRSHAPFDLDLEGVGAFPSEWNPRVVWVGVTRGREAIVRLAQDVRDVLRDEGSKAEEGPFVPHVTLFRVRSAQDRRAATELFAGSRPTPARRTVRVREFLLKESVLDRHGVTHTTIAAFPLVGTRE